MANQLRARLKRREWTSKSLFTVEGLCFRTAHFGGKTTVEEVVVLKPDGYLEQYADALQGLPTGNVLELGVYQGGSTLLFAAILEPDRLVGIDICKPIKAFDKIRADHPLGRRISVHYQTSQDDQAALDRIVAAEFEGPLDLVVDDACHYYEPTKRSFEILFPKLRPGGVYAIEDWGWGHTPNFHQWDDRPVLSNLIHQLLLISVAKPGLISSIRAFPGICFVHKGQAAPMGEPLDVDEMSSRPGRSLQLV